MCFFIKFVIVNAHDSQKERAFTFRIDTIDKLQKNNK